MNVYFIYMLVALLSILRKPLLLKKTMKVHFFYVLDAILYAYIEEDMSQDDIIAKGFDAEVVAKVIRLVDFNEYKRRQGAIGPRISSRAFSRERRYPIMNGWKAGI